MNIIGIICEYNPFHNGHKYHLDKVKDLFPDSIVILVLNGYFLERGEISIISKKDKTKIALENGIDLVVELPFVFGTQSADIFAYNAIKILEELKCEYVVFGSESNDIETLNKICDYKINKKELFNEEVKKYLDKGINYPTAMAKALHIQFEFNSNDLLGISYINVIKENNYNIKPITIKRTNNYLDTTSNEDIISATNIRSKLNNNENIQKYVPKNTLKYINNITLDNYFDIIKYKIITEKDLSIYLDVDEGIHYRLKKVINESSNTTELIEKVKTKRYTYNKIRRMIIHILIGLTKKDNINLELEYIKILGFNKNGKNYLNKIKKDIKLPITPLKDSEIYKFEVKTAQVYDMISKNDNYAFELSGKPVNFK